MEKADSMKLKLPSAFDGVSIIIYNNTGLGVLKFMQEKAKLVEGEWVVNIWLEKADGPKLHSPKNAG